MKVRSLLQLAKVQHKRAARRASKQQKRNSETNDPLEEPQIESVTEKSEAQTSSSYITDWNDVTEFEDGVAFMHVKGHSHHKWNDYADQLANRGSLGEFCQEGRYAL
jgi:ribonuclease HI